MNKPTDLILEYERLLKEGENSQGMDEETLLQQLAKIKKDYEKLTGGEDITKKI